MNANTVRPLSPDEHKFHSDFLAAYSNIAILTARHKATGEDHALLATIGRDDDGSIIIEPFARIQIPISIDDYMDPSST